MSYRNVIFLLREISNQNQNPTHGLLFTLYYSIPTYVTMSKKENSILCT